MLDKEYINCNLCGKNETAICFQVEERITGEREKFNVVKCRNCDLFYVNPRPKKEDILRYYPEGKYYVWEYKEDESFKSKLKQIIMEREGGYPQAKRKVFLLKFLRELCYLMLKKNVSIIVPFVEKGKILDVGCGSGEFSEWLSRHRWEVYGTEISQKAIEVASSRGLNIFYGELVSVKFQENFFDAVVINHVLEHVFYPMALIKEINRILKQDGLLIIGVPNIESYESKIFGKYWSPLEIPRHLYHFSYETLRTMLQKNGFSIEKVIGKFFSFLIPLNQAYDH